MKKVSTLIASIMMLAISNANAAILNFTGDIEFHNDVIQIDFTLNDDATNVRVWTDSFMSGVNFDPITALWDGMGNLIAENDDNDNIDPATQTFFDSGFSLPTLAAGDYSFTMATYANFASGNLLSDGFSYDDQAPIALSVWDQPSNDVDMGPFWSVWLDGVDNASNPNDPNMPPTVSAPATLGLFAFALLFAVRRAKK